jgi:molybdenum cofactor cytidylyltransferase
LLGQVVNNANGSILDKVVVVLGRSAAEVKKSLSFGRAIVVDNAAYPSGCASSLLAGLDAAGDCAGLMLLLGDQPGVGSEIVDLVAEEWLGHRSWVVVTSYRGELGHPFVFARSAFDDLRGLHGDKAIWKLIEAYPQRVRRVEVDLDLPPDIDTPEDYRKLLANWRAPDSAAPPNRGA